MERMSENFKYVWLVFDKGLPGFGYPSIKTFAALASLLMVFRRLFGLISWSFRLHSKNLTALGVNANFFGVFRSRLRNINGPEVLSSCCLQFRATDDAAWHLG